MACILLQQGKHIALFAFSLRVYVIKPQFSDGGFSDWKHASTRITEHDNSSGHCNSMVTWISRCNSLGRIDSSLEIQFTKEKEYWAKVLQRVVSIIKFLSSRGLAFCGNTEVFISQQNGNYLGILELLAEHDPFLSSHIAQYGNQGRGKASYLSSTIGEKVIEIKGHKVLKAIVEEIKEAKYFSLSVDSIPDISHSDQLTVVIRCAGKSDHKVIERFLHFIPIASHTREALANIVLKFFEQVGIDVANIRRQSYDNASNMSGCYTGMLQISSFNNLAHYIPCIAHSLNLVGVRAVKSCTGTVSFFALIQKLYNFFSGSTHRWSVMLQYLKAESETHSTLVVKKISDTR